jgi:hypothetical protein
MTQLRDMLIAGISAAAGEVCDAAGRAYYGGRSAGGDVRPSTRIAMSFGGIGGSQRRGYVNHPLWLKLLAMQVEMALLGLCPILRGQLEAVRP